MFIQGFKEILNYVELGYSTNPYSFLTPCSGRQKLCIKGIKPALGNGQASK